MGLFLFALLTVRTGYAQFNKTQSGGMPGSYAIKTHTINKGFPASGTICAIKNKKSLLWVGTNDGFGLFIYQL